MSSASTTRRRPRRKLAEAGGFKGDKITLSYNADAAHKEWTEATCNSIKQALGVECQAVGVVDFATFRSQIGDRKMKGMFRTGWQMDYPSIENFLAPIYETGASSNDGDYSNPAFDKLLVEACGRHRPGGGQRQVPGGRGAARERHALHPDVVRQDHDGLVGEGHRCEDHRLRDDRLLVDLHEVS